jgi:hypothetical protein
MEEVHVHNSAQLSGTDRRKGILMWGVGAEAVGFALAGADVLSVSSECA